MRTRFNKQLITTLSLGVVITMISPILVSAQDVYDADYFDTVSVYEIELPEDVDLVQANMKSNDGTSFVAYFNPLNGVVSLYDLNGISMGYHYVEDEEAFWEFVDAPRQNATVTFNTNGGSTNNTTRTVTVGNAVGNLPTPFRTNHTFRGWYTTSSGNAGVRVTPDTIVTGNTTFFARWYSHRSRTLTHTGSMMITGWSGNTLVSNPITFNGSTIPVGAVVDSISINAGDSTMSGAIIGNAMLISSSERGGELEIPWNGANNSNLNDTHFFRGQLARAVYTVRWRGTVVGNTPGNIINPGGTAAIRGFNNVRLTINYTVRL